MAAGSFLFLKEQIKDIIIRGFQKSSRALALSACSSNPFISTRRVESATVALCF
jgi:hypothetical protein